MALKECACYVTLLLCLTSGYLVESSNVTEPKPKGCPATENVKCSDGVLLPAWVTPGNDGGKGWIAVKAFVYFIIMIILFLGISIVSDRFMAAIEVITSQEKEITIKDKSSGKKHIVTVKIWNETVANLSLMALGSSAPEILLSVIEIIGRGFQAGELGPSTIVGSAAFNLFMITAVCVSVLPEGEVRRIKHLNVFAFTATCSVGAYVWMYLILSVFSPGVIEVWEGVITLICFPGMVGIAWMIDCNLNFYRYLRKKVRKTKKGGHTMVNTGDGDIVGLSVRDGDVEKNHFDEGYDAKEIELLAYKEGDDPEAHMKEKKRIAMEAYRKAKEKYPDADSETLQQLVEAENRKMQHKSRAYYRIQAVRNMTGQGAIVKKPNAKEIQAQIEEKKAEAEIVVHEEGIYFNPPEFTVVESCGTCYINVNRYGGSLYDEVKVDYETLDGSAVAGDDYDAAKGTLVFSPGETEKAIPINILDDDVFELDEHFYCKLSNVRCANTSRPPVPLGAAHTATVTILDDDYPGVFTIENARYEVMETVGVLTVRIIRLIGARGTVRIPYHTEAGTAKGGGEDFEDCIGEVEFPDEDFVRDVEIMIVDREEYEKDKVFHIVLGEPEIIHVQEAKISNIDAIEDEGLRKILEAGKPALGENKIAEVHIVECQEFKSTIDSMLGKANMASFLKSSSWAEQFKEAFEVSAGDDDDEDAEEVDPSYYDYFMHYLSLIWKVLFAFIPPTDIWGGWACFWSSISMIGALTAITGDVASHFGCTIGLADSVVAISFVALGTSLPDTFASKVATINDETADSSIGNVTGSNSVNVFLGIGLAWCVAACYHSAKGGQFEVNPGSLGFSVLIFCCEAVFCIALMMFRRFNPAIAAELGGPKGWRMITSTICACLWLNYVLLSALQTYCHINVSF
jgi:solute carrier family 8 (sodium/calcium exchanger)